VWTKHLKDPTKKTEFEKALRASTLALGRLIEIIEDKQKSLTRTEYKLEDFDQPNWSEKQAFRNGSKATLAELSEILDFIKG
jgi:hypothetical protein